MDVEQNRIVYLKHILVYVKRINMIQFFLVSVFIWNCKENEKKSVTNVVSNSDSINHNRKYLSQTILQRENLES